jgi:HTH-type transcriptional regulator / antitoxin HigA
MDIRPIRTDKDHAHALREIEKLWAKLPRAGSPEAEKLEVLVTLVEAFEAKHHPIDPPDPIEAIRFRMEQQGLSRTDLIPILGSRARVSEVLNGKRPLTLSMVARLRRGLGLSADALLGNYIAVREGLKLDRVEILTAEGRAAGTLSLDVADDGPDNESGLPAWVTGESNPRQRGVMIKHSVFKSWPVERVVAEVQEAAVPVVQAMLKARGGEGSPEAARKAVSRRLGALKAAILRGRRRLLDAQVMRAV